MKIFKKTSPLLYEASSFETSELFLQQAGEIAGPFDKDDIIQLLIRKEIPPTTFAKYAIEDPKWTPVSLLLKLGSIVEPPKKTRQYPVIKSKGARFLSVFFALTILALAASIILITLTNLEKNKKHIAELVSRDRQIREIIDSKAALLNENEGQLNVVKSEILEKETKLREIEERNGRLHADLNDASNNLLEESKKLSIFKDLSIALATDQQRLRETLLPAIGVPLNLFLNVHIGEGPLKIDKREIETNLAESLKVAGFQVFLKPPTDRRYFIVNYSFLQTSDTQEGFAAYVANVSCVGIAWHSGSSRPLTLFSDVGGGYAGRNSSYRKSISKDAAMFGEMLADTLGKIDRDALVVDYDMLDADSELKEAADMLRNLDPSEEDAVSGTGSGFIVSDKGLIVTNHHVLEGHETVEIWMPSTLKTYLGKVEAVDKLNDLAFVRIDSGTDFPADFKFPLIAKDLPEVGQMVFTVGFPVPEIMGREAKYSQGVLNAQSGDHDDARFLQHSIPIQPGNSGGLLVSEKGQVSGVVQSMINAQAFFGKVGSLPQNVNYAIKSERLWDFACAQKVESELSSGHRGPIEVKDAIKLSVMITTRAK